MVMAQWQTTSQSCESLIHSFSSVLAWTIVCLPMFLCEHLAHLLPFYLPLVEKNFFFSTPLWDPAEHHGALFVYIHINHR